MLENWLGILRDFYELERRGQADELLLAASERELEDSAQAVSLYLRLANYYADLQDVAAQAWWRLGLMAERRGDAVMADKYFRIVRARYPQQIDTSHVAGFKIWDGAKNSKPQIHPRMKASLR